jgi:hypothetical protein
VFCLVSDKKGNTSSKKGKNKISSSAIPRLDRQRILFNSAGVRDIYSLLV